jgi:hypothetical protein
VGNDQRLVVISLDNVLSIATREVSATKALVLRNLDDSLSIFSLFSIDLSALGVLTTELLRFLFGVVKLLSHFFGKFVHQILPSFLAYRILKLLVL